MIPDMVSKQKKLSRRVDANLLGSEKYMRVLHATLIDEMLQNRYLNICSFGQDVQVYSLPYNIDQ